MVTLAALALMVYTVPENDEAVGNVIATPAVTTTYLCDAVSVKADAVVM